MNQFEILFRNVSDDFSDVIIASLSEIGYESFWQSDKGLRAYINSDEFDEILIKEILIDYPFLSEVTYLVQPVTAQSWDVATEDLFEPIVIDHRCRVSGSNSGCDEKYPFELVVNAKLSFGSGHHPSTYLSLETILGMDLEQESVLDIGCGSGILSLLAEKKGATDILAFDNNPWAIEVAKENLLLNDSKNIDLLVGDTSSIEFKRKYPVVLANLNANVFRADMHNLVPFVHDKGSILLGGYMVKDEEEIHKLAKKEGLRLVSRLTRENWIVTVWRLD